MAIRAVDSTLVALILIGVLFSGVVFLIIDIPFFNPVGPITLSIVLLAMFLGLASGIFAGRWYTKDQLKILGQKSEFQGLGSKHSYYFLFSCLTLFLIWASVALFYRVLDLGSSLIIFTISATLTLCVSRIILINSWEKQNQKTVMMDWNKRIYVIPNSNNPPTSVQ